MNELVPMSTIENRIYTIRGVQVMIDRDIAELYSVETRRINEQVKRNQDRFPESFCFKLTEMEFESLMSQNAISNINSNRGGVRKLSYAFTEQGVAMCEISDRLIHTAPRSVSLVHYTFRNDIHSVIPQNRMNRRRNEPCEFVYAESPQIIVRCANAINNEQLIKTI